VVKISAARRYDIRARSLLRDLADGWTEFSARPWLWLVTVQFALFNLLTWGPYLVLGPVLAREYLGGARPWGAVLACYGGGAILGGLLALALQLPVAAVAAAALLVGLGSALGGAISDTVTQQRVPAQALSRVQSFNLAGGYAFGPVAFAAAGPVAAVLGARAVLGFGAAWAAFGTLVILAVPSVRSLTRQDTPPRQPFKKCLCRTNRSYSPSFSVLVPGGGASGRRRARNARCCPRAPRLLAEGKEGGREPADAGVTGS
jgi:MFS family permease